MERKVPKETNEGIRMRAPCPMGIRRLVAQNRRTPEHSEIFDEHGRFKKGKPQTGGRPKGTPNNFTSRIRQAFLQSFELMGSEKGLTEWALEYNDNLTEFYRILARLCPKDVNVHGGDEVGVGLFEGMGDGELDEIVNSCIGRLK